MAPPYTTKQWLLVNPPAVDGVAVVSGPDATWKLATVTLPGLEEGQILVKVRYISNDAGARGFSMCATLSPTPKPLGSRTIVHGPCKAKRRNGVLIP